MKEVLRGFLLEMEWETGAARLGVNPCRLELVAEHDEESCVPDAHEELGFQDRAEAYTLL